MNQQAAFLHVVGDVIMSVGVLLAASVIYFFPNLWWFDPMCTYIFSIIVIFTTIPIAKNCVGIMMEGAPRKFKIEDLKASIEKATEGDLVDIHDLHVWTIAQGKLSMSVHIKSLKPLKSLARVTDVCRRDYNLFHTTI